MKFVVGELSDAKEVIHYLEDFPEINRQRVMLMPEGVTLGRLNSIEEWLVRFCESHELVYCPRRQIEWYGSMRGT